MCSRVTAPFKSQHRISSGADIEDSCLYSESSIGGVAKGGPKGGLLDERASCRLRAASWVITSSVGLLSKFMLSASFSAPDTLVSPDITVAAVSAAGVVDTA